jgi:hypothetical protein
LTCGKQQHLFGDYPAALAALAVTSQSKGKDMSQHNAAAVHVPCPACGINAKPSRNANLHSPLWPGLLLQHQCASAPCPESVQQQQQQ